MKTVLRNGSILFALMAGLLIGPLPCAHAGCRYFRVASELLQCKEVNPADLSSLDRHENEIPELPTLVEGKLMRVSCSCGYTLYGSNPLCDFDRSQEIASVMGTADGPRPCAGARSFCDQICPQSLN